MTTSKQRVLVVDDEPRNQRIISEILEDMVDVKLVSSGEEALECMEAYAPDLVLLDIMMPGLDGYEVCARIRANSRLNLTRVILVSGKAMVEERLKGYSSGADDYMTKPFVPEELLAKAKVFLGLARAERRLSEWNCELEQKVEERTRQIRDAEGKLMNAAKMAALGEMAGGVAHEINTPLAIIGMLAEQLGEMMLDEPLDRKATAAKTNTIFLTVKRISSIINALRTFSRDGSKDPFDPAALRQIIEGTLRLCQERIKHAGITIKQREIPDTLTVRCQTVQISQVVLNLIGNACDAIENLPEKWIDLNVETRDGAIEISVTDSGRGVPESSREKLFQPFFTTKEIGKGTGLGLSISKGIMESHGGTLRLDPTSAHTRFVMRFGNAEASAGVPPKKAA